MVDGELVPLTRYRSRSQLSEAGASGSAVAGVDGGGGRHGGGGRLTRDESTTSRTRLLLRAQSSFASSRLDSELSDAAVTLLKEEMTKGKVSVWLYHYRGHLLHNS